MLEPTIKGLFVQVTTFGNLLTSTDEVKLGKSLTRHWNASVEACRLNEFDTQLDFQQHVNGFIGKGLMDEGLYSGAQPPLSAHSGNASSASRVAHSGSHVLLVQCASSRGALRSDLISCAQLTVIDCFQHLQAEEAALVQKVDKIEPTNAASKRNQLRYLIY